MKKYSEVSREYAETIAKTAGWSQEQSQKILDTIIRSSMEMLIAPELQKRDRAQKDAKEIATKQALKNYRLIKASVEAAVGETLQLAQDSEIVLLMEPEGGPKDRRVKSLRIQTAASKVLLRHLETALEEFRGICEDAENPRVRRQYSLIYDYYIAPREAAPEEIAAKHHIERVTFFTSIKEGIHTLSLLLYGVDSTTDFVLGKVSMQAREIELH